MGLVDPRSESFQDSIIKIDGSGVWHNVASESRALDPSGHLFSHRVAQCPTQPQHGRWCPARKKECGHSPNWPPQEDKARSSRSEETPDWLSTLNCQKVAWDSTLIYFPFLLLLQVAIHSLQLYSLASLLL